MRCGTRRCSSPRSTRGCRPRLAPNGFRSTGSRRPSTRTGRWPKIRPAHRVPPSSAARPTSQGGAPGSRKEIDPGLIVAGTALGSAELYNRVPELPARFLPTSYPHSPQVLSQLHSLVSVNFAVEVDLSGQVGAEVSRGVYVGAVGGQV